MKTTTLMIAALLLTGCAQKVWMKDGATAGDFERDKSACMFRVSTASDPFFASLFLGDCLKGRGYTLEQVTK
jgi:hypothetical protein